MAIKTDYWINRMAAKGMISDFVSTQVRRGVVSYGTTSYGYDMRVANEWVYFEPSTVVDPKLPLNTVTVIADTHIIPPRDFVLCRSLERFKMPRNVLGIVLGKSTYARVGLAVTCTPIEPEWEGHITIELANLTQNPLRVYANEGIAQLVFMSGKSPDVSYKDKKGKYQGQVGVTLPFVEKSPHIESSYLNRMEQLHDETDYDV